MDSANQNEVSYFDRSEVSNSDLIELKRRLFNLPELPKKALEFGTLLDAIITEPENYNVLTRTIKSTGLAYSIADVTKAKKMKASFLSNQLCSMFFNNSNFQKVFAKNMKIKHEGFAFEMPMRCKYDFWIESLGFGADLKSTAATSLSQFLQTIDFLDIDQSRALYMDISGAKQDFILAVSKASPHLVFCVKIEKGDSIYKRGRDKYRALAFKKFMEL